jgi:GMP synthase (glutamine-hydrolysing)
MGGAAETTAGGGPRVLVVQTGSTHPEVVAARGDYDAWFVGILGGLGVEAAVCRAHRGEAWPDLRAFDGVLLTGSPHSVRDEAPWMAALGRDAVAAAEAGVPVLAVCFGHQLVGEVLGGRVEPNPAGGEYGTIAVGLTPEGAADALFAGLPPVLAVQSTHRDALVRPPPGVVCLGGTDNTPLQAFACGPNLRAVQFHPEMDDAALAQLLAARGIPGETRPSAHGRALLSNWVRAWVRRPEAR